ncbi:hypothetical protein ACXIUT_15005 [Achromobacter denitrificans]
MSVDEGWLKILNPDNDLRRSLAFGGRPWKVEVERVKGIEPSYEAWEAAVLPFNYTRSGAVHRPDIEAPRSPDHRAARRCVHGGRRTQREARPMTVMSDCGSFTSASQCEVVWRPFRMQWLQSSKLNEISCAKFQVDWCDSSTLIGEIYLSH